MSKYIYVFGGDGYIGWPLSVKLALLNPSFKIVIFDNFFRRKAVKEIKSNSLTVISSIEKRISNFQKIYNQKNLYFVKLDLCYDSLEKYFKKKNIKYVYNLAQQSSAPFSMFSEDKTIFTAFNNEISNIKLLYAIKKFKPDIKYIKLGSFGEYCTANIDIPEGFFKPTFNKKTSKFLMPYPRQSDDFYHASKINDSNYLHVASKNWNLSVVEIMQSTIFGISTKETLNNKLFTRFDYDQFFGTVLNRFVVQAISNKNLTVYGNGKQRTGLMSLQDSIDSMSSLSTSYKFKKGHHIINHVTEKKFTINDIASKVINIAKVNGIKNLKISNKFNPRYENIKNKLNYNILSAYSDKSIKKNNFDDVLNAMFKEILKNKKRIKKETIFPTFKW